MAFREHFNRKQQIFKNISFDAEQGVAILKVTFSCDSPPKTHFVDILVGTLAEPRKKYSDLKICRLYFERVLSLVTM